MALIIDGFGHVMPKSFSDWMVKSYPTPEVNELSVFPYFGDIDNRLRVLDKHGIDKQVLTLARPPIFINMPANLLPEMVRRANDAVAEVARAHPDRFIAVGTLPVPTEDYLGEFDRCVKDLGMAGIQIVSNISGKELDDPAFRPFFAKANQAHTPIWLHPQLRAEWSQQYVLDKIFGWPYDTTLAIARLVFSGMMEEYENLNIIVHHMGAMVPYFSERIKGFYNSGIFPRAGFAPLKRDPLDYFRRFYGDAVLNGAVHALNAATNSSGRNILFSPQTTRSGRSKARNGWPSSWSRSGLPICPQTKKTWCGPATC